MDDLWRRVAPIVVGLVVWTAAATIVARPASAVTCAVDPVANGHVYKTTVDKALTVAAPGLLKSDTGTGIQVDVALSDTTSFDGGSITYSTNGAFTYRPAANFAGSDSFDYFVVDACGTTDWNEVDITVAPIVGSDSYTGTFNKTLSVDAPGVLANDKGIDGVASFAATSAKGGKVAGFSDGSFTYTPAHNFYGTDTFTYGALDTGLDATFKGGVKITVPRPSGTKVPPPATPPSGYWMVEQAGKVHAFGTVKRYGDASTPNVTHFEPTPSHLGYWIVNAAGKVSAFGDATSYGNANTASLAPGEIVSSLSATATGKGYWLFTSRGRAIPFGDAHFYGDMSKVALNGPVVGSIGTPSGHGYYMVASDGGIFTFGDAKFRGSMGGVRLNKPVEGLVPTADNGGYWLVASDGGIFAFGDANFHGSMGSTPLNKPIVGMVRYGNGYLMVGADGGIFDFSNKPFLGSLGNNPPPSPIVSVAA